MKVSQVGRNCAYDFVSLRLGVTRFFIDHAEPQRRKVIPKLPIFILHPSSFILFLVLVAAFFAATSTAQRRSGAHSARKPDAFTSADRATVDRAIGAMCSQRLRDPQASLPIDEMQSRPSLPVSDPDASAGRKRAERLLSSTETLVANAITSLAKEYNLYNTAGDRLRVSGAIARVEAVKRVKPDVDARDNASVLLRDPHTIEFGTIFLAGLRSDEAMISVLGHELTHIANGQTESLQPIFRAVARRASSRTGFHIRGQRAEELTCDLVGVIAVREFVTQTPSWEPRPRRMARAFEHNCVDDDTSDEDHLSPRNTIRTLFTLELNSAREILDGESISFLRPLGVH
jgi:hypothetical protein